MTRKTVGQCLTSEIIEKAYKWRTDDVFRGECRWTDGISGCDALFIAIDDDCGIKFFHTEKVAKMSYWMCRILRHFDYTAGVWDLRMVSHKGEHIWCFMMERCSVMSKVAETHGNRRRERLYEKSVKHLNNKLESRSNLFDADSHFGNFGITKSGRVRCIDVGHISYQCAGMLKYA